MREYLELLVSFFGGGILVVIANYFATPRLERTKFALERLEVRVRAHSEAHGLLKNLLWSLYGGEKTLGEDAGIEELEARCEYDVTACVEWIEKNALLLNKELRSEYRERVRVTLRESKKCNKSATDHEEKLQALCGKIEKAYDRISSGEDLWPKRRCLRCWWPKLMNCGNTCGKD